MGKNEVVTEEIATVETSEAVEKVEIEIRTDLNKIVKLARFENIKTKYGSRHPYIVTFFNDEKVEFADTEGFYDLLMSYKKCGKTDFVKSKALVEELRTNDEGEVIGKYVCMKYVLSDDSVYRLFVKNFSSNKIIDNYSY